MQNRERQEARPPKPAQARPRTTLEVAEIVRRYGEAYRQSHIISFEQTAALRFIAACRTSELGGHLDECPNGDFARPSYNSCGHRNCPKCQALEQVRWIESRKDRLLPVPYYHLVFTQPHELNPLVLRNQKVLYDLLFASVSAALLEVATDPKYLGGVPAVTLVLHTWSRDLRLHPHLHAIVSGGGLASSGEWIPCRKGFLLPKRVLAALLRHKYLAGLRALRDKGRLDFGGACADLSDRNTFDRLLSDLYATNWLVYAKEAFAGPENVIEYLGRYTHRTGISNSRLVSIDDQAVVFRTKDCNVVTVTPDEFLRRFLLHVLPKRFVKIRHNGLLAAANVNTRLVQARQALGAPKPPVRHPEKEDWRELVLRLTGVDPMCCPVCGQTLLRRELPKGVEYRLVAETSLSREDDSS